jgi:hypothetical protein
VVWTPNELHVEEIKRDPHSFQECLDKVNALAVHAILPEVIGCWYSKPRVESGPDHGEGTARFAYAEVQMMVQR